MGKMIELKAADGQTRSAYRADPAGKPRGGVVIQEIFGVNSHIKSVADGYARDGYVAIAPAMFDRVQKNVDLGYSPDDIAKGRHIRDKDQHIPVAGVKQLAEKYPQHQIFIYAADHGFNCDQRGSYNAAAAKQARERTLAFFRQHVG